MSFKQLAIIKFNEIYFKELEKGYYTNAANVKERINIKEPYKTNDGYTHYDHINIYRNGMQEIENINIKSISIDSESKVYKKV